MLYHIRYSEILQQCGKHSGSTAVTGRQYFDRGQDEWGALHGKRLLHHPYLPYQPDSKRPHNLAVNIWLQQLVHLLQVKIISKASAGHALKCWLLAIYIEQCWRSQGGRPGLQWLHEPMRQD